MVRRAESLRTISGFAARGLLRGRPGSPGSAVPVAQTQAVKRFSAALDNVTPT